MWYIHTGCNQLAILMRKVYHTSNPALTIPAGNMFQSVSSSAAKVVPEPYSCLESFKYLGSPDVLLRITRETQLPVHSTVIKMFSKVLASVLQSTQSKEQVCQAWGQRVPGSQLSLRLCETDYLLFIARNFPGRATRTNRDMKEAHTFLYRRAQISVSVRNHCTEYPGCVCLSVSRIQ